jgi:hypothetical protein
MENENTENKEIEIFDKAEIEEAKNKLDKPFKTPDGPKRFSVYTENESGNIVKINFGDFDKNIKDEDPEVINRYRETYNCNNQEPKWKANYWNCKLISKK